MIEENDISGIEGLMSVKSIGGQLIIRDNSSLESLTGLDSIDAGSITKLILDTSGSLSFCSVKSICDYLSLDLGPSEIGENLTGCNTEDEMCYQGFASDWKDERIVLDEYIDMMVVWDSYLSFLNLTFRTSDLKFSSPNGLCCISSQRMSLFSG